MSFRHLDRFAQVDSPVTRVPAAGRVFGTVALALATATLPAGAWVQLGILATVSAALLAIAHVPFRVALVRLSWPLGLVLLASGALLVVIPGEPLARLGPVAVTAQGGCGWTAASNDAWITVTGGASGTRTEEHT